MNGDNFLQSAIQQFSDYKSQGEKCFSQLSEKDFYYKFNEASNNLAIIITHLHGNMLSRWTNFLTEDGEKEWRDRDVEFDERNISRSKLMELWEEGWRVLFTSLNQLKPDDLDKVIFIRTHPLTVIEAIHRQLTHYASHVGQIIFISKMIRGNLWKTLSIDKGQSKAFNQKMKNQ